MKRSQMLAAVLLVGGCASGTQTPVGAEQGSVLPPAMISPSTMAGAPAAPPAVPGGTAAKPGDVKPPPVISGAAGSVAPMVPPTTTPPVAAMAGTTGAMAGAGGSAAPTPIVTATDPTVPAVKGECPAFRNGSITFMGLGGIEIVAGAKPAMATAPMVFYWHGTGSFAGEYAGMAAAVSQGVVSEGGVLVSFQDTTGGDLLSGTAIFGAGDLDLADQLFACAVKDQNVDPHRVFATGCSAGGLFSGAMAALRSSYIAAAAPNSGGWTVPQKFQNKHTPALMTIHGAAGVDVVIIDFSNSSATADMGFKTAGGFVINCDHGGGHCGGGGLAPDIWTFFKAHPFGVSPEPWTGGLPAGFNKACKIF